MILKTIQRSSGLPLPSQAQGARLFLPSQFQRVGPHLRLLESQHDFAQCLRDGAALAESCVGRVLAESKEAEALAES